MIIVSNKFSGLILGKRYTAMCVWPLLFLKPGIKLAENPVVLNHERIHVRQQLEMLWIFFFMWYGIEFMILWIRHGNQFHAYKKLSHEKEASENEADLNYLRKRKAFAWIRYLYDVTLKSN